MNILVCLEPGKPSRASQLALVLASGMGEDAHVMVLCAGGGTGSESLELARHTAAVERVFHIDDPALSEADFFTLGMVLGVASRHLQADLVLAGESSDDEGQGLVAAALAHELRVPLVSRVQALQASSLCPNSVEVSLRAGGRSCRIFCPLPIVASVPSRSARPSPPSRREPCVLDILSLEQLGIDPSRLVFRPDLLGTLVPGRPSPAEHLSVDEAAQRLLGHGS